MELDIPIYKAEDGFQHHWEDGFEIDVKSGNDGVVISANKAGLVSLAIQLLTLAQESTPVNTHFHLDHYNSLEKGSIELIISKV